MLCSGVKDGGGGVSFAEVRAGRLRPFRKTEGTISAGADVLPPRHPHPCRSADTRDFARMSHRCRAPSPCTVRRNERCRTCRRYSRPDTARTRGDRLLRARAVLERRQSPQMQRRGRHGSCSRLALVCRHPAFCCPGQPSGRAPRRRWRWSSRLAGCCPLPYLRYQGFCTQYAPPPRAVIMHCS